MTGGSGSATGVLRRSGLLMLTATARSWPRDRNRLATSSTPYQMAGCSEPARIHSSVGNPAERLALAATWARSATAGTEARRKAGPTATATLAVYQSV